MPCNGDSLTYYKYAELDTIRHAVACMVHAAVRPCGWACGLPVCGWLVCGRYGGAAVCMSTCAQTCTCVRMRACVFYLHVLAHACMRMRLRMCACVCACVLVCVCVRGVCVCVACVRVCVWPGSPRWMPRSTRRCTRAPRPHACMHGGWQD